MSKVSLNDAYVKIPLAFSNNYTDFLDYVLSETEKTILAKMRETAGWMSRKCKKGDIASLKHVTVSLGYLKKETKVAPNEILEAIGRLSEHGLLEKKVNGYSLVLKGGV